MELTVRTLTGSAIIAASDALAELRMRVFADWPYLYDGDRGYEIEYLRAFVAAPEAALIAASDGDRIVGAATALPLATAEDGAFRAPFVRHGLDPDSLFYFGESVLLPQYRGRGIGHAFFAAREAQARRCGASGACFAAVIRAPDHPARPADYAPLDPFWRKRGYAPVPGLTVTMAWKEHDEPGESEKPLQVWLRHLD